MTYFLLAAFGAACVGALMAVGYIIRFVFLTIAFMLNVIADLITTYRQTKTRKG